MTSSESSLTLPEAVAWLSAQRYPLGAATLRFACQAFKQGNPKGLRCQWYGAGQRLFYVVNRADVLAFSQQKFAPRPGKGRRPGTIGIKQKKEAAK